jgi:glycosyltransferase involved in cell wall biosynthesis
VRKYTSQEIKEFVSKPHFDEKIILNKDPSWPKISIVTPSYNQAKFLERTILSVLNQNYPNLEYIVIDGGSTDGSVEIIERYEKYLAYWVSEKDNGQSDALNKGFSKATGYIIGWQNSDDIYLPSAFYKIAQLFGMNHHTDIIYGNRLDINEKDRIIGESRFTRFSVIVYWYDGMLLSNQSAFWKKSLFSKIGMLDTRFHAVMDYEFFLRAGLKKSRFKHVPYYFGAIRRHSASKTSTIFGTPVQKKECTIIDSMYGRKIWLNHPLRMYSLLQRGANYFLQGDWDYLFKGFKRRIRLLVEKH